MKKKYITKGAGLLLICLLMSMTMTSQNLLLNPSFESGELEPWTAGNGNTVTIDSVGVHGVFAAVGNIEQIVSLTEGVNYTWTTQVKCLEGCDKNIFIGIKDLVGDALVTNFNFSDFTEFDTATIAFTAPSTGNHRFWVWGVAETGYASDNHVLLEEGTSSVQQSLLPSKEVEIFNTNDEIVIQSEEPLQGANISVHDLSGTLVYNSTASNGVNRIQKRHFPITGFYVVTVRFESIHKVQKISVLAH